MIGAKSIELFALKIIKRNVKLRVTHIKSAINILDVKENGKSVKQKKINLSTFLVFDRI